jgi:hypothetical protein
LVDETIKAQEPDGYLVSVPQMVPSRYSRHVLEKNVLEDVNVFVPGA